MYLLSDKHISRSLFTTWHRVYTSKKRVFLTDLSKTKGLPWRYPRKISLLKDLAVAFWREGRAFWLPRRALSADLENCPRTGEIKCCYQTANGVVTMLAACECLGQEEKRWCEARSVGWACSGRRVARSGFASSPPTDTRSTRKIPAQAELGRGHPRRQNENRRLGRAPLSPNSKGPTLTSESTTLAGAPLLFIMLLFDRLYEPSGACSTRKVLPPLDQTRISASFPLGTLDNAC